MLQDVFVEITRHTQPPTEIGFGVPLIIAETSGGQEYKSYRSLAQLEEDWDDTTDVYKVAAQMWAQDTGPERVAVAAVDDTTTPDADAYETLMEELDHEDWYAACLVTDDSTITKRVSDYINGNLADKDEAKKLLFIRRESDDLADDHSDDDRTVAFYHSDAHSRWPEAAWMGKCLPFMPGEITWKFKQLNSVLPLDDPEPLKTMHLSKAGLDDLHDPGTDNGAMNTYVTKMHWDQTSEGLVTSGEYIDTMRSTDFVYIRIKERVQRLLTQSPKVPLTNQGIAQVVTEVEAVMQKATAQGIIARDDDGNGLWEVSAPDRQDISEEDRMNRILPDVEFEYTLAGAVHEVHVRGVIRV